MALIPALRAGMAIKRDSEFIITRAVFGFSAGLTWLFVHRYSRFPGYLDIAR